ncbi:hypothetical protein FA10DRAFT_94667 [Acaromyces ingoldii]|uniref:Uncharacterized protein n=1 Tax=Acaromyces ingoldii TaxID=215250 RepID=A0A316YWT4_9BASI|nr:hypothetical protein FA10DRAFT_94667 [Acaromyces ingoldii]PWN92523.1 hypothetical protein FA10DRAFT_94667 [Acaromyces ingoldii]
MGSFRPAKLHRTTSMDWSSLAGLPCRRCRRCCCCCCRRRRRSGISAVYAGVCVSAHSPCRALVWSDRVKWAVRAEPCRSDERVLGWSIARLCRSLSPVASFFF